METNIHNELISGNSISGRVFLEAIGDLFKNNLEAWEKISDAYAASKGTKVKVQLLIEGIELPFVETLKQFEAQWDKEVRLEAVKLVEEKIQSIDSMVFRVHDILAEAQKQISRKLAAEFGVELEDRLNF